MQQGFYYHILLIHRAAFARFGGKFAYYVDCWYWKIFVLAGARGVATAWAVPG